MGEIGSLKRLHEDLMSDQLDRQKSGMETLAGVDIDRLWEGDSSWATRLIELSGSPDQGVRMAAAEIMESGIAVKGFETTAICGMLSQHMDAEPSYWAATFLGRLGIAGELGEVQSLVVSTLEIGLVESTYLPTRERCAWALGRIGHSAKAAMPVLREIAEQAPPRLRRLAVEALESIRGVAA